MVYVVPRVCSEGVADVGRAVRSITDIDMCCIEIVYFFPEGWQQIYHNFRRENKKNRIQNTQPARPNAENNCIEIADRIVVVSAYMFQDHP